MPKSARHLFILAWLVLYSPSSFAPDPSGFLRFELPEPAATVNHGFLVPNELFPQDGDRVFKAAGPGAYIAVGTERGFIHFGLTTKATHLILVDTDPEVARFNRINRMLLAASTSREDYLALRMAVSPEAWQEAARRDGGKVALAELVEPGSYEFWVKSRRFEKDLTVLDRMRFAALEKPSESNRQEELFGQGNYIQDEALYLRLSTAAKEGRIQVENFSLKSVKNFQAMTAALKAKEIPLSVFDVSNAWWGRFMPKDTMAALLDACKEIAGPGSLFLATDRLKSDLKNYHELLPHLSRRTRKSWLYLGFTFPMMEKMGGTRLFMDYLFEDTDREKRVVLLNDVNTEPYPRKGSCTKTLGGAAP